LLIKRIGQTLQFRWGLGKFFLEDAELFQPRELIDTLSTIILVAIHLMLRQAQDIIGRPRMANHAFGATGIMPCLLANTRLGSVVANFPIDVDPSTFHQGGIRLLLIPAVRITNPFVLLFD
jgi:hypothetical protein